MGQRDWDNRILIERCADTIQQPECRRQRRVGRRVGQIVARLIKSQYFTILALASMTCDDEAA